MSRLPDDAGLLIEGAKISDYLLNRDHKVGGAKAEFFLGNGFQVDQPEFFGAALKEHALTREIANQQDAEFGTKYTIECDLAFPDGASRCIRAVWLEESEGEFRLVTAYPVSP